VPNANPPLIRIPSPVVNGPPANAKVVPVFTSPLHGPPGQTPNAAGSGVNRILVSVASTTPVEPIPKVPIGEANAHPPKVKIDRRSLALTLSSDVCRRLPCGRRSYLLIVG